MSNPATRYSSVEVLRGTAASMVCAFHFSRFHFLGAGLLDQVAQLGFLGVDSFFVISGFVIPLALGKARFTPANTGRFLSARFFRLYPAFFFAAVMGIGLWYASALMPQFKGEPPHLRWGELFANATLTADFFGKDWVGPVFWTLAVEAQFYIAVALCFPLLGAGGLTSGLVVAGWTGVALLPQGNGSFLSFGPLFALGFLAFYKSEARLSRMTILVLAALAMMVQGVVRGYPSAIAGGATFAVITLAPDIRWRPLAALGTISYSLYLLHVPIGVRVINLGERWVRTSADRYLVFLMAFIVSVISAWILYALVERPSHRFAQKWWRSRRSPLPKPAATAPGAV